MRTRTMLLLGVGILIAGATTPAMADGAPLPVMGKGYSGHPGMGGPRPGMGTPRPGGGWSGMHRWAPRQNGRWYAGWRAPGGWNGYQRPIRGYILPRYWISPSYYIANYGTYGLPAPAYGYGWSRYYDDAVMTDRYGRVYDYRSDIDWNRYDGGYGDDGYDDRDRRRDDNGVGGAAIGAVVGGLAGNRIAGHGNRTAGTLIGAGVGAAAGYAIDKAEDDHRRDAPPPPRRPGAPYDEGYGYADDSVTYDNDYQGRWVGTWYGKDGTTYNGEYEGRFEGSARGAGVSYDAPPYAGRPHWSEGPAQGGYYANGYYYPAPTVTTVVVQPATTTTTTYVTETVSYRHPVARRKARRVCSCK